MVPPGPEVLRYLFGLPRQQIDADIAAADGRLLNLEEAIRAYATLRPAQRTPDRIALYYHQRFLQAHVIELDPAVHEDEAFYWAVMAAVDFAEDVGSAAFQNGRLAELACEMKKIEEREGLQPGECWAIGDGPPDYETLVEESDRLHEELVGSIIVEALRRYRFEKAAALFTENRMGYEVRYEVGRRLANPKARSSSEITSRIEERLLNEYGRKAYDLLKARLLAAGLPTE